MFPIKTTLFFMLYVLTGTYSIFSTSAPARSEKIRWIVEKTSTLRIAGRTNINKFCCQVTEYTDPDTLIAVKETGVAGTAGVFMQGAIRVDIEDFDCRNKVMTSEFKHTLKYHQYPKLIIRFLSLERLPSDGAGSETVKGWVEVELAGVCRKFEIAYISGRPGCTELELVGVRTFGFSDFALQAPRKMGGLVRVDDRLDVEFRLHLHQLN